MSKIIYLTSDIDCYERFFDENGNKIRKTHAIINHNNFFNNLKNDLNETLNFVFVASNKSNYETTDVYATTIKSAFEKSGFNLVSFVVLDDRTKNNAKSIVENANVIFLCGGHVPTQNEFINEIGLKELLNNFNGVIIGQSAGSMNSANIVYAQPELTGEAANPNFNRWLKGLNLTDINILPHYNLIKEDVLDGFHIIHDITFKDSFKTSVLIIPDGTYVRIENEKAQVFGLAWEMKNGIMKQICEDNQVKEINNRKS